jgi:SNF2 family DNA or RNA helicase
MLVVDESTQFKNSTGKRFRLLRGALNSFRRRYILTGTPAPNGLIDLFGQIYILDQGHALGRFVTHYRQKWFVPAGYRNYDWQPVEGAEREIAKAIEPITVRMRAEDYINMPQLQNHFIMLDLPTGARRHYNELEQEFFTLLEEEPIVAPNTAVAGGKCRQILNGAIYTEKPEWKAVHDAKLEALGDLMSELSGQPLLVLYEFQHDRERIMKEYRGFRYIGGSNMQKQQHIVNGFNSGRVKYVIGHPKSMGHALNLQGKCAHVCWYGLTWNLEHYDQAIRRVWRSGNEAPRVIVHHLCIRNSLDQAVVQALGRKHKTQTTLTEAIRSLHSQFR